MDLSAFYNVCLSNEKQKSRKLKLFCGDIPPKKRTIAKKEKIKLEIDFESRQNEIKKLNKKYNIKMFTVVYVEKKHTLPNRKTSFLE